MSVKIKSIAVIGDGGWGSTLAVYLAKKGWPVTVWGAFAKNIEDIQRTRFNQKFLPGVRFPRNIALTTDLGQAINSSDLVILAVPSKFIRPVLKQIKGVLFDDKIFLSVVKGICPKDLLLMSQLITQELGDIDLAVLSGPTIAKEVAQGIPSTAVIAAKKKTTAQLLQKLLHSETFRIYTNQDIVGLELGGSLKNIIAIASGVCDGLGFGTNTKAAILTRGLVEMARLGKAMGAQQATFNGLAGLGDLVTTCMSQQSRNRFVGEQLGQGKSIKSIITHMNMVAEGVETANAVYKLSKKYKVTMPITTEVYRILYHHKSPRQAVFDLMTRKLKAE